MNRTRENDDGHDSVQLNTNFCHKKGKCSRSIADAIKSSMVHALALQSVITMDNKQSQKIFSVIALVGSKMCGFESVRSKYGWYGFFIHKFWICRHKFGSHHFEGIDTIYPPSTAIRIAKSNYINSTSAAHKLCASTRHPRRTFVVTIAALCRRHDFAHTLLIRSHRAHIKWSAIEVFGNVAIYQCGERVCSPCLQSLFDH